MNKKQEVKKITIPTRCQVCGKSVSIVKFDDNRKEYVCLNCIKDEDKKSISA